MAINPADIHLKYRERAFPDGHYDEKGLFIVKPNQAIPVKEGSSLDQAIKELNLANAGKSASSDPISPAHYQQHPSGIECIRITEHMDFNLGNAVKYIWRCDLKKDSIEDLRKAKWYLEREIAKRTPVL